MTDRVSREQKVTQSVQDYLKEQMFTVRGYSTDTVEVMDAWDGGSMPTPLRKNYIATGYGFDNGGSSAEMGSSLIRRLYTVEFLIFAQNATWGRNLGSQIAMALEEDGLIPLKDVGQPGAPVIDQLVLDGNGPQVQREPPGPDPPEWQKFVWSVRLRVWDEYFATLV